MQRIESFGVIQTSKVMGVLFFAFGLLLELVIRVASRTRYTKRRYCDEKKLQRGLRNGAYGANRLRLHRVSLQCNALLSVQCCRKGGWRNRNRNS